MKPVLAGAAVSVASDARATADVFATGATNALAPLRARAAMIRCMFLRAEIEYGIEYGCYAYIESRTARGRSGLRVLNRVRLLCFCLSQRARPVARFESIVIKQWMYFVR